MDNDPTQSNTAPPTDALPLHELELTPQWLKTPAKSFDRHPGSDADRPRSDRDRRPGGPHRDREGGRDRQRGDRPPGLPANNPTVALRNTHRVTSANPNTSRNARNIHPIHRSKIFKSHSCRKKRDSPP